jgi:hypothetical protein
MNYSIVGALCSVMSPERRVHRNDAALLTVRSAS